ncbi:MAG: 30S ribosomal protein S15 [Spirochaetes bacterium]|jgi:small subunit ribosomal protein S15|nr:30S ribosomal protein S15 [Spirochaetota bacterium]
MTMIAPKETIREFGKNENDSGSTEVQIALLTRQIEKIAKHLETNAKDHHNRFGLVKMVGQRRKLLRYLIRTDRASYQKLIEKLGLRK